MPKYIGDSKVPVMEFCEYCWEVLNEDGTCPTDGCVHNDLMDEEHKRKELLNVDMAIRTE